MKNTELKKALSETNAISLGKSSQPEKVALKNQLFKATSWCPEDYSIATRIFVVMNDLEEVPKCVCGNDNIPNKLNNKLGFSEYCSSKCVRENRLPKSVSEKLSSKEWLTEHRITKRMAKEAIAAMLGISPTPVYRWLEIHNIKEVWYNESEASIKEKLEDKSYLESEYSTGSTCAEIAAKIGTSASSVWVYMEKHGIQMRLPNEYDRVGGISMEEQSVVDFVKSIYGGQVVQGTRGILGDGREIDIYLPELKFAIEYNGLYSHIHRPEETTYSKRKDETYHVSKTEKCADSGIFLMHIFSDQWTQKRSIVENMIRAKIGLNSHRCGARSCEIKEINPKEKGVFLEEFHLSGNDQSQIALGAYYKNLLVAVMTFGTPRFSTKYDWELIRFCVRGGWSVTGGFSKLLKHFRNQNSGTIVSYADRTVSDGDVYTKNGFSLVGTNKPSTWTVNFNTHSRVRRTAMMKKNMTADLGGGHDYSERELKNILGVKTIFDCGTLVFVV